MKVIDLLNKIAKGEEVPKGIEHNGDLYLWEKNDKTYYSEPNGADLMAYIDIPSELNDEIEIIEEEKEISKITKEEFERLDKRTLLELIVKNQNEIIDELNKIKKEGK